MMGCVNHGHEVFKTLGGNYIELKTSKRVLKGQQLLKKCLEGVRGDTERGLSKSEIQHLMHFHLNSTHWDHKLVKKIKNDSKTIHIFASKDERDKHNKRRLKHVNTKDTPIAIIKSVSLTSCKTKARDH